MPTERRLTIEDLAPRVPVVRARDGAPLSLLPPDAWRGRLVLDHGCGDAVLREPLARLGATHVGLDPFGVSAELACPGDAIPLADASVDVAISQAVLHLVPDPRRDVAELARVLRPGGRLVGYVAFLETAQEQSKFHASAAGIEELARAGGLELVELGAGASGIEYQLGSLLVPFGAAPWLRRFVRGCARMAFETVVGVQSSLFARVRARRRGTDVDEERARWRLLLTTAHAAGFTFVMRKPGTNELRVPLPSLDALVRSPATGAPLLRRPPGSVAARSGALPDADAWLVDESAGLAWPVRGRQRQLRHDAAIALAR